MRTLILALCSLVALLGCPSLAKEGGTLLGKPGKPVISAPARQTVTPTGHLRSGADEESDADMAVRMWRNVMGDAPIPERIRKKYGIPPEVK